MANSFEDLRISTPHLDMLIDSIPGRQLVLTQSQYNDGSIETDKLTAALMEIREIISRVKE